jgi:iron-sulfur cluster repair protein YtfE (RIC family)
MADPFAALKHDHREVEEMFQKYEESGDYEVLMKLCRELSMHSVVEEEVVYPLLRAKVSAGMADEARDEHQEAKDIIRRIEAMGPDDSGVRDVAQQLKQSVQHHVEEEEHDLFPKMEQEIPTLTETLGADIESRKADLRAQAAHDEELGLPPSATAQKPVATQGSITGDQPRNEP